MIRVALAQEPPTFDQSIRQRGLSAIAEMVGEEPTRRRPGPRRGRIAAHRNQIPASAFPDYWTEAISDLLRLYHRRCAFNACYIEPGNGVPTADHMIPKSRTWDQVYEWNNYRLASHLMNSLKSDLSNFLDPFEVQNDWFGMELVDFGVFLRPSFPINLKAAGDNTQRCLNHRDFRQLRGEYVAEYERGLPYDFLERRSPFVANELRRQGRLRPEDV